MKIFIVWEKFFNYLDSIAYAFEVNGCDTAKYVIKNFKQEATFWDKMALKFGNKSQIRAYNLAISDEIYNRCLEFDADIFLMINGNFTAIVDEGLLKKLHKKEIKTVLWLVDGLCNYGFNKEYLNSYNEIFTFEQQDIRRLRNKYGIKASYLPLGAAAEIYQHNAELEPKYDICFIGTREEKRLKLLELVAGYCKEHDRSMLVRGELWQNGKEKSRREFKKHYPNLYEYADNKRVNPSEVADIYNVSKINLNIITSRHSGINPRTFEILAARGFQLVDYNEDYETIFKNKQELVWYQSASELLDLIDHYLKNDTERRLIAATGHQLVMNKYLLTHLVKQIIGGE